MGMDCIDLLLKPVLCSIHGATSMLYIAAPDLYHFHHEHPVVTFTKWGFGSSGVLTRLEGQALVYHPSTDTHSEASSRGRATQTRLGGGLKDEVCDGRTRMLAYSFQGGAITEVNPMMLTANRSFLKRTKASYQHQPTSLSLDPSLMSIARDRHAPTHPDCPQP